jgi:tetratricopeptide (TPR) repeat protein
LAAILEVPHQGPEATSLLGEPLYALKLDAETQAKRDDELTRALTRYEQGPLDEENAIWLGRRLAYLGRYHDAITVYSGGLALHPGSYKLLRHRGHRFITIRRLEAAIADLERAAALMKGVTDEVEPDGLPNRLNIPTSTSHTNIYYHLGLARYLRGEFDEARLAYRRCLELVTNNDMRCATSYWLYLTLRRLGRDQRAVAVLGPITPDMEIIENHAYHRLLLLFKEELAPEDLIDMAAADSIDDATLGYGLGAWHLVNGRREEAFEVFGRIISGTTWPAFGFIAAEAEVRRKGLRDKGTEGLRGATE